jgi:putative endonuclease
VSRARNILGEIGENLACDELVRRGYAILARRYRSRGGEIDIVAECGETVVFVEVKTRDGAAYGSGADAVTWTKRRRIVAAATDFLVRRRMTGRPCRFDVVSIAVSAEGPVVEVISHAFDLSDNGFRA